ncbi:tetratricopeptide repeat protein [Marilutibacter maris]|uniref:tetratricopeptide repeat protein n=1 Tax=Marilutibacter maris TaxID=1605891 RepID=UPI00167C7EED|nr:tetratricopeptide repeat protein [Lysobacter maris]
MRAASGSARSRTAVALALALALIAAAATPAVATSSLERLFERGRFDAFLDRARDAAQRDDAEALFLLGKAYDLGRGVEADAGTARAYYERARALGSARASHNLGVMAMSADDNDEAIALFEEALARGLRVPTLYNLGRAHTPPDPTTSFGLRGFVDRARTAGGYYAQACDEAPDAACIADAGRQFLRAYMIARQMPTMTDEELSQLRESALLWLRKGTEAGDGLAWTNYGVLLKLDGDDAGARKAFEAGIEREVPVAYFQLAELARAGEGFEQRDTALALKLYEQAADAGIREAMAPAFRLLQERLEHEEDPAVLERGLQRLASLQPEPGFGDYGIGRLQKRLDWLQFRALNRQSFPARAISAREDMTLALDACGLDLGGAHGAAYNIGVNSHWRLVAYAAPGEPVRLPIEGRVDAKGCVRKPLKLNEELYRLINDGAEFALGFPNYSLPLLVRFEGEHLVLELRPLGTPLPP